MIPKLVDDELDRYWVPVEWIERPQREQGVFVVLLSANENDEPQVLGNGFVVYAADNSALCLGAAHSFEAVKNIERKKTARGHLEVPFDFRVRGPEYFSSDRIKALVIVDDEPIVCDLGHLNYLDGYDVAAFGVHAPQGREIFTSNVALDLSAPRPGDEIAVLANYLTMEPISTEPESQMKLTQRFEMRLGVVTEVIMGPSGHSNQSFIFKTTVPVTPGMSGAPVIAKPRKGEPVVVRGVVSSDFSEEAAFRSLLVPGSSAVSMPWPAMGLAMPVEIPPAKPAHLFLGDLLHKKVLDDRSDHVTVHVRQSGDKTELLYVDERQQPPVSILLTMQGHPNVEPKAATLNAD